MKIAFFWTWDFSKNILKNILKSEKKVEIKLIVSQADKPIWRKKEILPTPVKSLALDEKIEVLQPEKLKENKDFFWKAKKLRFRFYCCRCLWKDNSQRNLRNSKILMYKHSLKFITFI